VERRKRGNPLGRNWEGQQKERTEGREDGRSKGGRAGRREGERAKNSDVLTTHL
jgi:hypothetical protein